MRVHTELVGFLVIVELGRDVDHQARRGADALHAVQHQRRDHEQHGILLTQEELVHEPVRGRLLAPVVEDDLHHAADADEMVGLLLVIVPTLHDTGIRARHIRLPELLVELVVRAQHLHEVTALVGNDFELLGPNSVDQLHGVPLPKLSYLNPRAAMRSGVYTLRQSMKTSPRITFLRRAKSNSRNWFHSVTRSSASQPSAIS